MNAIKWIGIGQINDMKYIGLVNIGPFLSYYEQNISFSLYGKINGTFITIKWIGAVIDFGLLATLLIGI